jgi:hypothetical protein
LAALWENHYLSIRPHCSSSRYTSKSE